MAKKNVVHLMGIIEEIMTEDKSLISLKIRKNANKFVYPLIEIDDEEVKNKIEVGKIICVEGKVTTTPKEMVYKCPNCGGEVHNKFIFTTITAKKIVVIESAEQEPYINSVILLGTVCKEKEFKYIKGTKSPVGNTKYQIAVNRREPSSTDYPWISTFAKQAEEDANRIDVGSQILVDGVINTRLNTKQCVCEKCEEIIEVREHHTEILGSTVEYLNNCLFE